MIIINNLKHSAIGIVAGTVDSFVVNRINKICRVSKSIFCLNTNHLIHPSTLQAFYQPIFLSTNAVKSFIQRWIPSIPLFAKNCEELLHLFPQYSKQPSGCCSDAILSHSNVSNLLSTSISEEFIFRYLFQKKALSGFAKLLPGRIGKSLGSPITRIVISSLFFTFAHAQQASIAHHFTAGLIYGFLMERYGLLAAISAHFTSNVLLTLQFKNQCENKIMEALKAYY